MTIKRVLIISPYFPPSNAADMQRIRMSLPYFKTFGWRAEVICVEPKYSEMDKDSLLLESLPKDTVIHLVKAFSKNWTGKLGLGSLALRSLLFYKQKVNALLRRESYDLIYFSTTQFPLCILGAYWKKKFKIPYVIDMQDPWHSDHYQNLAPDKRPPKHWFSYRLNKWLEPIAMKNVSGIISVSKSYIDTLQARYKRIESIPSSVITFGVLETDFDLVKRNHLQSAVAKKENLFTLVYVGRGGDDMADSLKIIFSNFMLGLKKFPDLFENVRFHFIGTSYAPAGEGRKTISPLANEMGLSEYVQEQTDRISYFQTLKTLKEADGLLMIGSNDNRYTASKIFPYILCRRPLLGIFHAKSSVISIAQRCNAARIIEIGEGGESCFEKIKSFITDIKENNVPATNWLEFKPFEAKSLTERQCSLFNEVLNLK